MTNPDQTVTEEQAWRAGFQAARDCLSDEAVYCLTADVEADAWLDSPLRLATSAPDGDAVERAAKAHCDYFGGDGWWDSGLLADTKPEAIKAMQAAIAAMQDAPARKYALGERLTKTKGSSWTGRVVGFYSTSLTPVGYAIESENEPGSVQIYPESALSPVKGTSNAD